MYIKWGREIGNGTQTIRSEDIYMCVCVYTYLCIWQISI